MKSCVEVRVGAELVAHAAGTIAAISLIGAIAFMSPALSRSAQPSEPGSVGDLTADHIATNRGEVPTEGDWFGWIDLSVTSPTMQMSSRLGITLDHDGEGNLTGRMAGEANSVKTGGYACPYSQTPAKLSSNLVGQYTPKRNAMSLTLTGRNVVKGRWECVPPGAAVGPEHFVGEWGDGLINAPILDRLLQSLNLADNGTVQAELVDDTIAPQTVMRAKLTLQQTKDRTSSADGR
jgi:hypothetical protein